APVQNGYFGRETQQAVAAFQSAAGLSPDGVVGPLTWQALYNTYLGVDNVIPPGTDAGVTEYVVRSGDTLWLIARRYNTTVDAIKRLNGLTGDNLNIGQVLRIPTSESTGGSYFEYVVRSGDSLWLIAQRYNTTVDAIKNLNGLSGNALSIGQILKIPSAGASPVPYFEYTVRSGDTLWQLARRYGTTVSAIKSLNGLSSDILNIGQVLLIPSD
ncbi:MAG: LysM peptidoglycan-binding domain-containing protein, partial [Lachnospiraceae bacterium]|nr:LysM peptidoglycan-binding domain-containing protein [Lachnospiraceae bacterium]